MALFTPADLAAYLRDEIRPEHAKAAHDIAAGVITGHTRQHIERSDYVHTLLVEPGGEVALPQVPVLEVRSVAVRGVALPAGRWRWDGVSPSLHVSVNEVAVDVDYTAGYDPVPLVVRAVALSIAARVVANPAGVRSESIDDYQVTHADPGVGLTDPERRLLRLVVPAAGTVRAR